MNLESLRYFYLIARAGNISSVARTAHISQSALSQQINKLETALSKTLMERSNKGVRLTPIGEIVYDFAESVLKNYDHLFLDIKEYEKANMVIKIKACHSISDYGLPCTLINSNKKHPSHKYELFSGSSEEVISDIANNLYDVGFSYCLGKEKDKHNDLIHIKCGVNKLVMVGKYSEKLPSQMTPSQISDSCFITFSGESDINNMLEKNLLKEGYSQENLNCKLEVGTIESAKKLISKGYGLAFLPYISVKEELYKKEFKEITIPGFKMDLEVTMLFKKNHSEYVEEFIKWFIEEGKNSFC